MLYEPLQYISYGIDFKNIHPLAKLLLNLINLNLIEYTDTIYNSSRFVLFCCVFITIVSALFRVLVWRFHKKYSNFNYLFFRLGETIVPVTSKFLYIPIIVNFLKQFECYEGEEDGKYNLHFNCNLPCFDYEHRVHLSVTIVFLTVYAIVS